MQESFGNRAQAFGAELSQAFGTIGENIPTFERTLDQYFERNSGAIVEEWNLLTTRDLSQLEQRLNAVSLEIDLLYGSKERLERRVERLDTEIGMLEERAR